VRYEISDDTQAKRKQLQLDRQLQLYKTIFRDISEIVDVLLPSDRGLRIKTHVKSVMYALIELKTGKQIKKF
jgi:hypothetical protein